MSENTGFGEGAKVVISPDKMRAWVTLPRPAGAAYTAEAIAAWLPGQGVVYGVQPTMLKEAAESRRYDELLEVARGDYPKEPTAGGYELLVEKRPFSGLRGTADGALFYDDFSFLQEVQQGQHLAEILEASPGAPGRTVTGEELPCKEAAEARGLEGSGWVLSEDGRYAVAPGLGHVSVAGQQLIFTPLAKLAGLTAADGPFVFNGNVLVEGNLEAGAEIRAEGSVFVAGRAVAANITAGRNVLLAKGMAAQGGFGKIVARENVWAQILDASSVTAGGDLCANQLTGCEATAEGRALILGGKGAITNTTLYARGGVVAQQLGSQDGAKTTVACGLDADFVERFEGMEKRVAKLALEIQSLLQNITAFERVNRMKPPQAMQRPEYQDMVKRKDQNMGVMNILNGERTRLKRTMDAASNVSIIAREAAYPGVTVAISTRTLTVQNKMQRVKFRRAGDVVEAVAVSGR